MICMFNIIPKPEYATFYIFGRKITAKGGFLHDFVLAK